MIYIYIYILKKNWKMGLHGSIRTPLHRYKLLCFFLIIPIYTIEIFLIKSILCSIDG